MMSKDKDKIQKYIISFDQRLPGHVIAHAENKMGKVVSNGSVIISDIDEPSMITTKQTIFAVGDAATIECGAIIYNYSSRIDWYLDKKNVDEIPGIIVKNYTTKYSYRRALKWQYINKNFSGLYSCQFFDRYSGKYAKNLRVPIVVNDPEAPNIITNFVKKTYEKSVGDSFIVKCNASGLPIPTLIWYKNNEVFKPRKNGNDSRKYIVISDDNTNITFNYLSEEDSGKYKCRAENRIAVNQKEFELVVEGK